MSFRFIFSRCCVLLSVCYTFTGCSSASRWECCKLRTGEKEFDSARALYAGQDKEHELDVEILRTGQSYTLFLVLRGHPISGMQGDDKQTRVRITTHEGTLDTSAVRYDGGQRFRLDPKDRNRILESLRSGHPVVVELGDYRTVVTPDRLPSIGHQL